jgi:hypothetical protein
MRSAACAISLERTSTGAEAWNDNRCDRNSVLPLNGRPRRFFGGFDHVNRRTLGGLSSAVPSLNARARALRPKTHILWGDTRPRRPGMVEPALTRSGEMRVSTHGNSVVVVLRLSLPPRPEDQTRADSFRRQLDRCDRRIRLGAGNRWLLGRGDTRIRRDQGVHLLGVGAGVDQQLDLVPSLRTKEDGGDDLRNSGAVRLPTPARAIPTYS